MKYRLSGNLVPVCLRLTSFFSSSHINKHLWSRSNFWLHILPRSIFRCGECKVCFSEHILSVLFKVQSRLMVIKTKVRKRAKLVWEKRSQGDGYQICLLPHTPLALLFQPCTCTPWHYNVATRVLKTKTIVTKDLPTRNGESIMEIVGFTCAVKEGKNLSAKSDNTSNIKIADKYWRGIKQIHMTGRSLRSAIFILLVKVWQFLPT